MADHDRIEGAAKNIGGKIKEAAGKVTGDTKLQAEGKADQVKSDVADAVKDGANKVVGSFKDDSDK